MFRIIIIYMSYAIDLKNHKMESKNIYQLKRYLMQRIYCKIKDVRLI